MSNKIIKVVSPIDLELEAVKFMKVSDNFADVWLRKNIEKTTRKEMMGETEQEYEVFIADEIHFVADPSKMSKSDIELNFDKYWIYAQNYVDNSSLTDAEKIALLEKENERLNSCLHELCNLI